MNAPGDFPLYPSRSSQFLAPSQQTDMRSSLGNPIHLDAKQQRPPILVVEDNAVNQTITVNQLAGLGYAAAVVQNGQEALDALGPITDWPQGYPPYRLIFMDCNMPIMDGYKATREIRRLEATVKDMYCQENSGSSPAIAPPPIAIVALTANVMATDRVRAFSVGMDDYLTKPVTVSTLKRTVERWLPMGTFSADQVAKMDMSNFPNNEGVRPGSGGFPHQSFLDQDSTIASANAQPSIPQNEMGPSEPQPHLSERPHVVLSNVSEASRSLDEPSLDEERGTLSHLDWSYLHALSDSDHDFETTLLELFIEDCQEQLRQLTKAIAQSNLIQIEKIAHYIKGASANVGAQVMQHYAHQIEQQVRQTQLICFDTEMSRLETSLSIVQEMFAAL